MEQTLPAEHERTIHADTVKFAVASGRCQDQRADLVRRSQTLQATRGLAPGQRRECGCNELAASGFGHPYSLLRGIRRTASIGTRIELEDVMDKPHHPQVIRTWTVARIKVPFHPARPAKPQRFRGSTRNPRRRVF